MNPSLQIFSLRKKRVLANVIATTAALCWLMPVGNHHAIWATLKDSPKVIVDEVWQIVNEEYVDTSFNQTDWQVIRQQLLNRSYTSQSQAYQAIHDALETLGDPYTRFSEPAEYRALNAQTAGELFGVGIRLIVEEDSQQLMIVETIENSPASQAQLRAGDYILSIDGASTQGLTLEDASTFIRGDVGTSITLTIARPKPGEPAQKSFDVMLTRAQIELVSVHYTLKQENRMQVGYISIDEFTVHAPAQMQQAIRELSTQSVDGYVLDLRGNPGGLLYAGIEIALMWINDGEIVHIVDREAGEQTFSANQTALTQLPLVVLVDGNSASASEILAGALQDNQRAMIIGSSTYGKAAIQSRYALSDGSGLAITTARYYPPNHMDINQIGIIPDVEIDLTHAQQQYLAARPMLQGTLEDPQYVRALSVLENTVLAKVMRGMGV